MIVAKDAFNPKGVDLVNFTFLHNFYYNYVCMYIDVMILTKQ